MYRPDRMTATLPSSTDAEDDRFDPTDWSLFLSISLIWGASFLLIDIGLDALHPGAITLARVALGAATLAALPGDRTPLDRSDRALLIAVSAVWVGIPFTLFPLAEQHINSATTGLLQGVTPVFATLIATVAYRLRPSAQLLTGLAFGMFGLVLMSMPSLGEGSSEALGVGLVVLAALCYGAAQNMARPLLQRYGALATMGRVLALATIWTTPFGLYGMAESELAAGPIAAVAVLGVVGTGVAYLVMGTLVRRVGAPRASFITYVIPVVSLVLGVTIRDDEVAAIAIVGMVVVMVGATFASRPQARPAAS